MSDRVAPLETITSSGVIAVLRGIDAGTVGPAGEAIAAGGVTAIEVTADTSGATEQIGTLSEQFAERNIAVGAGTVLDSETARTVIRAGAEFIVSPSLQKPVIRTANRYDVPVVPGVMTPTEAVSALEAGADAVKLFPASSLGPSHLAALRGPLSQLDLIPTGGVTIENAGEFIDAGAIAVGVGSALLSDEIAEQEDWSVLEDRAGAFVQTVADARQ